MLWLHWKRMPPWADRGLSYCRFCRNRTGLMLAMQEHYQFSDEEIYGHYLTQVPLVIWQCEMQLLQVR
mgnify:CR=1 FL=1